MYEACDLGAETIAFPAIGTEGFRFPIDIASKIAMDVLTTFIEDTFAKDMTVIIVCKPEMEIFSEYKKRLEELYMKLREEEFFSLSFQSSNEEVILTSEYTGSVENPFVDNDEIELDEDSEEEEVYEVEQGKYNEFFTENDNYLQNEEPYRQKEENYGDHYNRYRFEYEFDYRGKGMNRYEIQDMIDCMEEDIETSTIKAALNLGIHTKNTSYRMIKL